MNQTTENQENNRLIISLQIACFSQPTVQNLRYLVLHQERIKIFTFDGVFALKNYLNYSSKFNILADPFSFTRLNGSTRVQN